jgi:hypothetical protein
MALIFCYCYIMISIGLAFIKYMITFRDPNFNIIEEFG